MYTKFFTVITLAVVLTGISSCVFEQPLQPVAPIEPPVNVTVLKSPQTIPSNARWYMPDIRYYVADDIKSYSAVVDQVFKEYNDAGSLRFFASSQKDSADIFIEFADLGSIPEKNTGGLFPQKYATFEGFQLANYTVEIGVIHFPEIFRATIQLNKQMDTLWNQKLVKATLLYQVGKIMGLEDSNGTNSALQKQLNSKQPITTLSTEDKSKFKNIYDVREEEKWEAKKFTLPLTIYPNSPGVPKETMESISIGNQLYLVHGSILYRYESASNQFTKITNAEGRVFEFEKNIHMLVAIPNGSYPIDYNLYRLNGTIWEKRKTVNFNFLQTYSNQALPLNLFTFGSRETYNNYDIYRRRFVSLGSKLYSFTSIFSSSRLREYNWFNEIDLLTNEKKTTYPLDLLYTKKIADDIKPFGENLLLYVNGLYIIYNPKSTRFEVIGRSTFSSNYPSHFQFGISNRIYFLVSPDIAQVGATTYKTIGYNYWEYNPFNRRCNTRKYLGSTKDGVNSEVIFNYNTEQPYFENFSNDSNGYIIRCAKASTVPAQNYLLVFTPHKTFSK